MKDFLVTYDNKTLKDIVPYKDTETGKVTFLTVQDERKLVQQLVKLFLTPVETHILGYGVDYAEISEQEIIKMLEFYNEVTETDNPKEMVDSVVVKQIAPYEFEVTLTTKAGTEILLKVGI